MACEREELHVLTSHHLNRLARSAAGGAAVALLLAGCGQPAQTPKVTSVKSSAQKATTTASAPPAAPTSLQLKADSWLSYGHFLIESRFGQNDYDGRGHEGTVTLFHPAYGEIDLDAKNLLPGDDVTYQRYASSGPVDNPYIAGIFEVRVPSHDLEPEATVVYLAQIDPKTKKISKKAEVGRYGDGQQAPSIGLLAGTTGDVVAWGTGDTATGYDFAASKQAWSRPGRLDNATFGTGGAVLDIPSTTRAGGVGCPHQAIIDLATGADIFDADTFAMKTNDKYCGSLRQTVFSAVGLVALIYNPENKAGAEYYHPAAAYDFVHRRNLVIGPSTEFADERSPLVGVVPESRDSANAFEVRDSLTGDLVYAMPRDKAAALNFRVRSLFNKQLFVETTDEKLVVDATNGSTISRGWQSMPVAVADSWVLYSDGKFVKQ
ncbi:hypothetical protein EB75_03515 [Mycobacterium sp. ST-F2]|jgi:hypothetical protein|nr:hypothetical protein EB75_03515 [Mycobacterium sp. ST-F2]